MDKPDSAAPRLTTKPTWPVATHRCKLCDALWRREPDGGMTWANAASTRCEHYDSALEPLSTAAPLAVILNLLPCLYSSDDSPSEAGKKGICNDCEGEMVMNSDLRWIGKHSPFGCGVAAAEHLLSAAAPRQPEGPQDLGDEEIAALESHFDYLRDYLGGHTPEEALGRRALAEVKRRRSHPVVSRADAGLRQKVEEVAAWAEDEMRKSLTAASEYREAKNIDMTDIASTRSLALRHVAEKLRNALLASAEPSADAPLDAWRGALCAVLKSSPTGARDNCGCGSAGMCDGHLNSIFARIDAALAAAPRDRPETPTLREALGSWESPQLNLTMLGVLNAAAEKVQDRSLLALDLYAVRDLLKSAAAAPLGAPVARPSTPDFHRLAAHEGCDPGCTVHALHVAADAAWGHFDYLLKRGALTREETPFVESLRSALMAADRPTDSPKKQSPAPVASPEVLDERERCARIAETSHEDLMGPSKPSSDYIAREIRKGTPAPAASLEVEALDALRNLMASHGHGPECSCGSACRGARAVLQKAGRK